MTVDRTLATGGRVDTNTARVARVVERIGAEVVLRDTAGNVRLQRVQDAWLRDLSRRAVQAASPELRLQLARRASSAVTPASDEPPAGAAGRADLA